MDGKVSVGILARDDKWARSLQKAGVDHPYTLNGWTPVDAPRNGAWSHLIERSDLIWIPEKINGGMCEAIHAVRKSKHLLLGFPVVDFMGQAFKLLQLAREADVQIQTGHHEPYHPAIQTCMPFVDHPQAISIQHQVPANSPWEAPPWFLKEMVSDLALVLPLIPGREKKIRAHASMNGQRQPISIDIRIEFHNGTLVCMQYRSLFDQSLRTIEIIQYNSIVDIDLIAGESKKVPVLGTQPIQVGDSEIIWKAPIGKSPLHSSQSSDIHRQVTQCINFVKAITKGEKLPSSLEDGFRALEVARQIQSQICRY